MTSHEQPPTKRRRDDASDLAPQRSDIWFEDGNIVLSAQGKTLFCVYRGVLSSKSTVFRDMLVVGQPDTQETVDGKPLVLLHDSPEDITHMLHALFDWHQYFPVDRVWDAHAAISLLRTSSKYQIDHIRKEVVRRLYRCFPTTVSAFDADYESSASLLEYSGGEDCDNDYTLLFMVRVALSHGIPSILPAILARANFSIAMLIEAHDNEDATRRLGSADLRRLLTASQRLVVWQTTAMPLCFRPPPGVCSAPATCRRDGIASLRRLFRGDPSEYAALLYDAKQNCWDLPDLCEGCADHMHEEYDTQRAVLWDKLPGFLDLPDWAVLEKEREDALV